jgi:Ribosome 60S biogenesis N-terminal
LARAIAQLGKALLDAHLKPLYFHLSGEDHARANHALAFLTCAVSLSSDHTASFLQRFDFSLSALPKLAAPPHARSGVAPPDKATQHKRWVLAKLAKRPSRACFVALALACVNTASDGPAVAAALSTPNLVGLVLNNVAKDPPAAAQQTCAALLRCLQVPDVPASAAAACLRGGALLQLAAVSHGAAEPTAAQAAHELLTAACTSSAAGLWSVEQQRVVLLEAPRGLGSVTDAEPSSKFAGATDLDSVNATSSTRSIWKPSKAILGALASPYHLLSYPSC